MEKQKEEKKPLDHIAAGLVTGASGDDPAGIATYAVSGIRYGYSQLWLLLVSTPMLIAVQSMAARIAIVTKKGLSANFKSHFSTKIALGAVALLLTANVLTIGADIAAMSEAMSLLIPGTQLIHWVVPISFVTWYMVVFFNYQQIRKYLLWLIALFGAFILSAVFSKPDWGEVLRNFVWPEISFNRGYFLAALALVGTTVSPYMFYWEARETIEEKTPKRFAKFQDWLQAPGFILSNFIAAMIMISTATLLSGAVNVDFTSAQVARSLEPVAGSYATMLFAVGIIGAGLISVPVLAASAALALSGVFGWREGLSLKPTRAKGFYEVISISILIGVQIAISGFDPIKALFYSQVITGALTPPLIILMLILANNKKVMGNHTNNWFDNLFSFLTVAVLLAAIIGFYLTA